MERVAIDNLIAWVHRTSGKPQARVLMIHGLGEHSARHLATAETFLKNNIEVVRFDLRGAGESGGVRQYVDKFTDYVDDCIAVHNWLSRTQESLPLLVFGHSLGGAIAIYFSARYNQELSALILSAPALYTGSGISPLKIMVGKMLVRFAPQARIPKSTDPDAISRDPAAVAAYESDPLACHFNTLNQGNEILMALDKLPTQLPRITVPVALFHGTSDRIIRPDGSFEILQKLGSKHKELCYLPGGYHEPHNDIDKQQYFALLSQWLQRHLRQASTQDQPPKKRGKSKSDKEARA